MKKENKLQASLPKGFKDRWGDELALKNKLVDTIKEVFINYSFEQLETPEFEKSINIGSFLAEDESNPMSDVFSFVKEKESFTNDPRNEPASSGIYYFSSGKLLINFCKSLKEKKLSVNGEFFVSMIYKLMLKKKFYIKTFKIDHFLNLGKPEDYNDFCKWYNSFNSYNQIKYLDKKKI